MMRSPVPAEALPPLYSAVGQLVINWANIDLTISRIVALVYQAAGGKHQAHGIPKPLNRRTRFLRHCFAMVAPLKPFDADLITILDSVDQMAAIRNAVTHGALAGYTPTTGQYAFIGIDALGRQDVHQVAAFSLTVPALRASTVDVQRLVRTSLAFEERLRDAFGQ